MRAAKIGRIKWAGKPSEFEVQAKLYMALLDAGFQVRGEVRACQQFGDRLRRCKFDLVVFDSQKKAVAIIETKSTSGPKAALLRATKPTTQQCFRYSSFGVPVIYCGHMNSIRAVVCDVSELIWP